MAFNLNLSDGLVKQAIFIASDNCDQRESGAEPEAIIIHCISLPPGKYGNSHVVDFFTNQLKVDQHDYFKEIASLEVSAHFFIKRDGELIQFVPTHLRAWHAGESSCLGKPAVNNFSIGIEVEGLDTDPSGFTELQYSSLVQLIKCLQTAYPKILKQNLFAHSDIAPGRKPDPGAFFEWNKVIQN